MRVHQRQASPLEPFNFMLCSSIFLISLSQNPHLERASIISYFWNPSILSLVLPLLPIFSFVKSPRSLMKLSSSYWKYAKATPVSIFFLSFHKHTSREQSSSLTPAISSHIPIIFSSGNRSSFSLSC
ncbi:hypothetical protein PRUPE_6G056000 [Prunus persica]|uniref:Uncharacterized protein n=1 Tax=Prunus persica TaxID=3760 RepID=A0A251NKP7_PRUPE|nr:hypothetical protein PRUPE_6G056000 [Prunus persica]